MKEPIYCGYLEVRQNESEKMYSFRIVLYVAVHFKRKNPVSCGVVRSFAPFARPSEAMRLGKQMAKDLGLKLVRPPWLGKCK